jgi:hypothetical protein
MVAVLQESGTIKGSRGLQQFSHAPNVIADSSGHCWSHAKRLVDATKIVEGKPARNRCPVVLPLLTEGIREARKSACAHTDTQVLTLHNRSANTLGIGTAHDWDHLRRSYVGGAVAGFAVARSLIDLDEHSVVATVMQGCADRRAVAAKPSVVI